MVYSGTDLSHLKLSTSSFLTRWPNYFIRRCVDIGHPLRKGDYPNSVDRVPVSSSAQQVFIWSKKGGRRHSVLSYYGGAWARQSTLPLSLQETRN